MGGARAGCPGRASAGKAPRQQRGWPAAASRGDADADAVGGGGSSARASCRGDGAPHGSVVVTLVPCLPLCCPETFAQTRWPAGRLCRGDTPDKWVGDGGLGEHPRVARAARALSGLSHEVQPPPRPPPPPLRHTPQALHPAEAAPSSACLSCPQQPPRARGRGCRRCCHGPPPAPPPPSGPPESPCGARARSLVGEESQWAPAPPIDGPQRPRRIRYFFTKCCARPLPNACDLPNIGHVEAASPPNLVSSPLTGSLELI